jgi:asparagine synthase (glutamine-hydrolysing)
MLKMRLAAGELSGPWSWTGRRWRAGTSWIEPYEHPALEAAGLACSGSTLMLVRERHPGAARPPAMSTTTTDKYHAKLAQALAWRTDTVVIEINSAGNARITAGFSGVAPLYVAVDRDGVLHGSWDITDLCVHVDGTKLTAREVARRLAMRFRYGHDTAFDGIKRLTERSTATFDLHGLCLAYPTAAAHSTARDLREDVDTDDVVASYDRHLGTTLCRHRYEPEVTAVQLSGGVDSANVAVSLADSHPGLITPAALLLPGDGGVQQHRRRAEMIRRMGLGRDLTFDALTLPPLHPAGRLGSQGPISPYADPYDDAMGVLLGQLATHCIRYVFTGVGGDEMLARTIAERPHLPFGVDRTPAPWLGPAVLERLDEIDDGIAPASIVNEMTLLALACAAPTMLRTGMWPVHPLADPDLITFGEWLPVDWRTGKHLHRQRLASIGLSPDAQWPTVPENFIPVMHHGLATHGLPLIRRMLAGGSPLIEDGYLNPDELAATVRRIADGHVTERDFELNDALTVDAAVRSFI